MVKCTGNCDGKNEGKTVEMVPGVTANLCGDCVGQFYADLRAVAKSYGFRAISSAPEVFDEIKGIG